MLKASPWRAALGAGLLAFTLLLPLAAILQPVLYPEGAGAGTGDVEGGWPVLGLSSVYIGLLSGMFAALRLRRTPLVARRRLLHEFAGLFAVVGVWGGAVLAQLTAALWLLASGEFSPLAAVSASAGSPLVAGVASCAGYVLGRMAALLWPIWNRVRSTHLLWALTHAQLVAALLLAAIVATYLTTTSFLTGAFGPPGGPESLPDDVGIVATSLAWVVMRLLPALTALLVLSVATTVCVLPPAALISYLVLRRTTGRLEKLAAAAGALRSGDLTARVPIDGEDEVSQLQGAFNAMAHDLGRTLRDLEAERDRVTGLLDARRQLVASVSHELRTPVATVRGYLESALRHEDGMPPDLRADLRTMGDEIARLERLIEDLFTLSRAAVGRLELSLAPTDAGAIVRRLVGTTAPLAWQRRRVEVLADIDADLPPARADTRRLEQIVSNLLTNAVRHTPPGGMVAAAVAAEPHAVRIEVRDTGEGIAPDDLSRVFERFYRGRNGVDQSGAGLGLALTRDLAEAMGGSVEAESALGVGSCFTVRLPRG